MRNSSLVSAFFAFATIGCGEAWRSGGGRSAAELADKLEMNERIPRQVAEALRRVDRAKYCRSVRGAYDDCPQSIGFGATISAPHMHAHALTVLDPWLRRPNAKVLDVGSGSGIVAAAALELMLIHEEEAGAERSAGGGSSGEGGASDECEGAAAGEAVTSGGGGGGMVVGIEHIRELVDWSIENVIQDGKGHHLDSNRLQLLLGDGFEGHVAEAPYDAIHVGAAPEKVPQNLLTQMKVGGVLLIPVGPQGNQQYVKIVKGEDGRLNSEALFGVRYVPLTTVDKQLRGR